MVAFRAEKGLPSRAFWRLQSLFSCFIESMKNALLFFLFVTGIYSKHRSQIVKVRFFFVAELLGKIWLSLNLGPRATGIYGFSIGLPVTRMNGSSYLVVGSLTSSALGADVCSRFCAKNCLKS
jgi:hypothetical protein